MTSKLRTLLIPAEARQWPGQRWMNIALRTLHLIGVAGISGGFLFALDESAWHSYWYLATYSGAILSMLYVLSSGAWLLQLRGMAILLKLVLLFACLHLPEWRTELFIAILLISGLIAHAPSKVRGWSPFIKPAATPSRHHRHRQS